MSTYYAILTAVGEAKLANATALGTVLQLSKMAVGDGSGALPTPVRTQTALIRETYRADLNTLNIDPLNPSQIIAELVIPETEGGYWLREMGIYDAAGDLFAVANCPPSYKPQMSEGSGRTQVLRMVLIVSSTAAVQLKIDPSVVLATRDYVTTTVAAALVSARGNANPQMDGVANPGSAEKLSREDHRHPVDTSRAPLDSPAFTGTPRAPTLPLTVNNNQLATTAFVVAAVAALVDSSPESLNTLKELAAALGNDANFAASMTNALAGKLNITGGNLSGFLNLTRNLTGGYGENSGGGLEWGAPIWSIGPANAGTAAGPGYNPSTLYGLAWLRNSHPSLLASEVGEGIYLYRSGLKCGFGEQGFYTTGKYTGKGTGLTDIPQAGVTGLVAALLAKASLESPVFAGNPTVPAQPAADSSLRAANTAHVKAAISAALNAPVTGTANNYSVTLPGGLILKVGNFNKGSSFAEGELTTITFTDAFPNNCFWGGALAGNSAGISNAEAIYQLYSKSRANAVIWAEHVTAAGMNSREFNWIFIGN